MDVVETMDYLMGLCKKDLSDNPFDFKEMSQLEPEDEDAPVGSAKKQKVHKSSDVRQFIDSLDLSEKPICDEYERPDREN